MASNATNDRRFYEAKIPPVVWGALAAAIVYLVDAIAVDELLRSGWSQLVGVALALCGFGLAIVAVGGFSRAGTTVNPHAVAKASSLVTSGPFRFSRNPMYLGMLLVLLGWGFWLDSLTALALGVVFFVGVMTVAQIWPEERTMRVLFGDEYLEWCGRVRRWL